MPSKSAAQHRLMEAAAHTPGGYGGVPQKVGEEFVSKDDERGKLNEKEQHEAEKNHQQREDMPASAFLEGESRKYPVKAERDGEWKYDKDLLLAAEKEAEMHGHKDLAAKAKRIREHHFSNHAHDEMKLAVDRSMRSIDADGRLHVVVTNISKATVNPYYGNEIPGYRELGLGPEQIYNLLRDPGELERGATTFNNIPLLSKHIPVSADDPQKDFVVGATGSNAQFVTPYLRNSLVVWDSSAIAGIESRDSCELSCAYRYVPVMTPGTFEGMAYDGVMTQIVGNHVALVEVGRAGPDVMVSDSNPFVEPPIMKKANGKTIAVRAAVRAYLRPMLAADAALDLKSLIGDVTAMSEADARKLVTAIQGTAKLAKDANLNDLHRVIMDAAEAEKEETAEDDEEETEEERKAREAKEAEQAKDDEDEDEDEEEKEKDKDKAMDAAIKAAEANAVKRVRAIHQAEKDVQPLVGDVAAMDSADEVYKFALDHAGIDVTDVHPSAYRVLVQQAVSAKSHRPNLAQDAESAKGFWDQFNGIKLPQRA